MSRNGSGSRIVCFGELLLRLTAPGRELLLQSGRLDVHVGGAEANVAVGLARMGHQAAMISRVPENALGDAAVGHLRRYGVDATGVAAGPGRMGLYFLSPGAAQRASEIVYDREGSSFALADSGDFDWDAAARRRRSGCTCRASRRRSGRSPRGWRRRLPKPPPPRGSRSRSTAITAPSCGGAGTPIRARS